MKADVFIFILCGVFFAVLGWHHAAKQQSMMLRSRMVKEMRAFSKWTYWEQEAGIPLDNLDDEHLLELYKIHIRSILTYLP